MKINGWKLLGIIAIIILIVIVYLAVLLEVGRSLTFNCLDKLFELDDHYDFHKRVQSKEKVMISLTTTPERIGLIYPTIASLLDQTVKVDEIAINVPYTSRKGKEYVIPDWMKKLKSITIHRVEVDEGPSTKLIPTLRREKLSTRIIVFDDDNIYHSRTVELLVNAFESYAEKGKRVAVTHYGVLLEKDGTIPPFVSLSRTKTMLSGPQKVDLLQGCHGFIVIPSFFPYQSLESKSRPPEAISVDDIWFSCWMAITGTTIRSLGSTWKHVPLVNFGEVNKTPKLVNGENKGLVRDQMVVDWFMEKYDFRPVKSQSQSRNPNKTRK